MENNQSQDARSAKDALETLGATRAGVADRLVTPWWYHPILGLLVAQLVLVVGLVDESAWRVVSAGLLIVGAAALITVYTKMTGLTVTRPSGPRSSAWFWAIVVVIALPILRVSVSSVDTVEAVAWGAVALIGTIVFGRVYDNAYRADLREGGLR